MNSKNDTLRRKLSGWYSLSRRKLPWRETRDPYRIWVSEVMLQQTRVPTVIPYYEAFVRDYPTVEHLADADLQQVLKNWEGLGYYARARNLHRAAGMITERFNGGFPEKMSLALQLPGVGDYIASAVLSIAFSKPCAVADGNVKRVLARLFLMDAFVNEQKFHKAFKAEAEALLDRKEPGGFNQAVMELGALICIPRRPRCGECPVSRYCGAFVSGKTEEYPRRTPSRRVPVRRHAAAVIRREGKLFIVRRPDQGLLGGLWEFPADEILPGESPENACGRIIREKLGISADIQAHHTRVRHAYTHFRLEMEVFLCRYVSGNIRLQGPADGKWISPEETDAYPFTGVSRRFLPSLFKTAVCGITDEKEKS